MTKTLKVLCVDTSTEACSVALLIKNEQKNIISDHFMLAPREHTRKILPTIELILKEANISLNDIDVIAYGRGPGSFTGVRIGISIAQGLAFGIDKKMLGVSTLQAMAQQAYEVEQVKEVYAAIDARMGEVYFAHYRYDGELMTLVDVERVIHPSDLLALKLNVDGPICLVGTGWKAYPELETYFSNLKMLDIEYPGARFMLKQVEKGIEMHQTQFPEDALPVYLRDTVTWKKLPGK
ncbi:tRNA (adenosine(37)-N6)-threonylcarbamoyltransferase complex dimerization subunit type 1 TsaB [Psychromonas sp. CD1]|uniref:tRNA (adenosine(37)-N6)-threonylcarbamoyltransferase complex dimerization subunit type 1 TsaB n=1 Tax=Psychromonas sp. CD1 TaxID=1979839 RepID=UPI000B9AE09C|nr:tRNA (adenosine(37)-N6)-threonylcarbamoyltransferase complex dimerization subunit type 1 TsaB [Psychromonas sp. CD1]